MRGTLFIDAHLYGRFSVGAHEGSENGNTALAFELGKLLTDNARISLIVSRDYLELLAEESADAFALSITIWTAGLEYLVSMAKGPLRLLRKPILIVSFEDVAPKVVGTAPGTRTDAMITAVAKTTISLVRISCPLFSNCFMWFFPYLLT